jgi:hypothetical protein
MKNVPRIKLETKKVMAYPKDKTSEDNYELYSCHHCGEEYLSQGIKEEEEMFCPLHSDHKMCVWCDKTNKESEMREQDEEFYCKECFSPKCIQCDEPIDEEEDKQFCSKQCYNEYWSDIMEDEYKDR